MRSVGKIGKDTLERLFTDKTGARCDSIVQGPAIGCDIAIVDLGNDNGLAIASDPVSFIPQLGLKESAWLSVIIPANDVATSGFVPKYAQFVMNLPDQVSDKDLEKYWYYIHLFSKQHGISITGGHTSFDNLSTSTLIGGATMFAPIVLSKVKSSSYAKADQVIIQTKTAALSSAAILAMSFPNYVKRELGDDVQQHLADTFYQSSVIPEVKALSAHPTVMAGVSAMHDVTEGGVLGAVYELSIAGEVGVEVHVDRIHIGKEQKDICELFNISPLRSVGAGSLLIVCEPDVSEQIVDLLDAVGISANVIAKTTEPKKGRKLYTSEGVEEFDYYERDPYWNAYLEAVKNKID